MVPLSASYSGSVAASSSYLIFKMADESSHSLLEGRKKGAFSIQKFHLLIDALVLTWCPVHYWITHQIWVMGEASCSTPPKLPGWEWRDRILLVWQEGRFPSGGDKCIISWCGNELMVMRFQFVSHLEIGNEATPPLTSCVLSPFLELWVWFLVFLLL